MSRSSAASKADGDAEKRKLDQARKRAMKKPPRGPDPVNVSQPAPSKEDHHVKRRG